MQCLRRLSGINFSNFCETKEAFQLFKCHREYTKMTDILLQPPSHVKGMKSLDKGQFEKAVTVPCIYLPLSTINESQKSLHSYLLKLQNFRPLSIPTQMFVDALEKNGVNASVEKGKMAILDPRKLKTYSDINEKDKGILEKFGIHEKYFGSVEMTLKYDNWKADEILRAIIPSQFDSVSGYSLVGHIIHLNLRDHLLDYKQIIGAVLLDKIKPARTVVNKVDIIDNTFRNFQMEVICGDNDMVVKVHENKCIFEFDFSQVYWNPRLCTEHERIVSKLKKGDIVYDVFCGVGPFSVPAAKKGCYVLANDLNPESVKWLRTNLKLNKVEKNVEVFNKDGGQFIKEDIRRHMLTLKAVESRSLYIIMNLPALAPTFLSCFHNLFSEEELEQIEFFSTPKVVVYCFVKGVYDDSNITALNIISNGLGMKIETQDEEVDDIFFVRDVAPNKKMMRIVLKLTKRILRNMKRPSNLVAEDEICESKRSCH